MPFQLLDYQYIRILLKDKALLNNLLNHLIYELLSSDLKYEPLKSHFFVHIQ